MPEYVEIIKRTMIGSATCLEWKSVDEFEHYIRSIAPKGKITGIYGRGFEGFDGDTATRPPITIEIKTVRLRSTVEREQARAAERARKVEAAAAKQAAKKAAREKEAELRDLLERAEIRLDKKRAEVEDFFSTHPEVERQSDGD